MPKGLGDNPLKKENRSRRTGLATPSRLGAKSVSASYNDVFFHRRPEDSAPTDTSPVEEKYIESVSAAPIVTASVPVPEIATPLAPDVTSVSIDPAPMEPVQTALTLAPLSDPSPVVAVEAAPQPHEQAPAEPAPQPLPTAAIASQESKPGFFGRIFGRLRK